MRDMSRWTFKELKYLARKEGWDVQEIEGECVIYTDIEYPVDGEEEEEEEEEQQTPEKEMNDA